MDSQAKSVVTLAHIWDKLLRIEALLEKQNPNPSTTTDAKPASLEKQNPKSEALSFCLAHDWLFIRARNGQYPNTIANKAAADFLSRHGPADRLLFSARLRERRSSLEGRVRVEPGLFENLFNDFVINGR